MLAHAPIPHAFASLLLTCSASPLPTAQVPRARWFPGCTDWGTSGIRGTTWGCRTRPLLGWRNRAPRSSPLQVLVYWREWVGERGGKESKEKGWWRGEVMEMEEGGGYQCRHWESRISRWERWEGRESTGWHTFLAASSTDFKWCLYCGQWAWLGLWERREERWRHLHSQLEFQVP